MESFDIPLALFPRDYSTEGLMGHLFCDANHQINEWVPVSSETLPGSSTFIVITAAAGR